MEPQIRKVAIELRDTIIRAKEYSQVKNHDELFFEAEAIISSLAYLTGPKAELEQAYRQKIVSLIEEGHSVAKAEATAKASDEYKSWRKVEAIYALGEEQIKILKKWNTDLAAEFKRS